MPGIATPYANRLKKAGYKLTNARLTVLDVLAESGGHITSGEVLDAVAARDESIGRASVFRTLDLLTRLSIVRPTFIDSSVTPNYVLMEGGHHHHIICTTCNRVIEFEDCGLEKLSQHLAEKYHVHITGHMLEFFAQCDACRDADRDD
ncbi:transcriptional repressor [Phototrophicus methaneseepsis]|uniref:Transcriptional repressor n=1 Tax=Phototrophicus methaneseepsis TaxID=2710758 RepID=A0A7S8EC95_9CHLR|nr:Fur family transcriptional regulator [Phototrophicus methaneseepsis]QPC84279.1 transcriptional repressor [Phototrophicus methaneseepsis]